MMKNLEKIKINFKTKLGDNIPDVLNDIDKELRSDSGLYSEFVACKNKHNKLENDRHKGIIPDSQYMLRQSRLIEAILTLIDRMEMKDLYSFNKGPLSKTGVDAGRPGLERNDRKKNFARLLSNKKAKVLLAVIAILLVAGYFLLSRRASEPQPSGVQAAPPPTRKYVPSDFQILKRTTVIDFRPWRRVPIALIQKDRFSPTLWHQYLEIEKIGESDGFDVNHWSTSFMLDFSCISMECEKADREPGVAKPGEAQYNKYKIGFDVGKYLIHERFNIEYQAVYWNAYQKEETESIAVIASNPTKVIVFEMYFSDQTVDEVPVFRFAKKEENLNYHKFENPKFTYSNRHMVWTIENPDMDTFYGVQWKWKKK